MSCVDEYQDCYFMSKYKKALLQLGDGTVWIRDVCFLPGQKEKMLKRINEDVNNYLEKLIYKHGDIFYKYDISNDFRMVRIYKVSSDISRGWHYDLEIEAYGRIAPLTWLYHDIKKDNSEGMNQIIDFIEPGDLQR